MSQSHRAVADARGRGRAEEGEFPIDSPEEIRAILTALDDTDCRAVLAATAEQTLTASELAEECGLPLSTTYRKLELLTDAGLLDEQTRLRQTGKHVSEYALLIDDLTVSVDADEGIQLEVSYTGTDSLSF